MGLEVGLHPIRIAYLVELNSRPTWVLILSTRLAQGVNFFLKVFFTPWLI